MTDIHTLAVDTDTRLADLHARLAKQSHYRRWAVDSLHRIAGHRKVNGRFVASLSDVDPSTLSPWNQRDWADTQAKVHQHDEAINHLRDEIADLDAVWSFHGRWSRFFLVTNTNGHIHSSLNCSTCRIDTQFAWLPTLSGLTEAEAVEAHGSILCSVCFPSAPVEWTNGESKAAQAAKAERAAAKAERDAKRLAKALLPDGSPLVVVISEANERFGQRREEFATLASAKTWLTNAAEWSRGGGEHPFYPRHAIDTVALAVAAKLGTTPEAEIAAAKLRAAKRR